MRILLFLCISVLSLPAFAGSAPSILRFVDSSEVVLEEGVDEVEVEVYPTSLAQDHLQKLRKPLFKKLLERLKLKLERRENPRLVAALLTILAGPFGMHRLYLGTDVKVPVMYALTLGGGFGIIPLIDLGVILFSKDIEGFLNNSRFLMWSSPPIQ